MKQQKAIRVIKSAERQIADGPAKTEGNNRQSLRNVTREAAGNVAAWVKEFQQRRQPDPRRAFASLFIETASPLNSVS